MTTPLKSTSKSTIHNTKTWDGDGLKDTPSHSYHAIPFESKKDKRRRDQVARIERIRDDNLRRREEIYTNAWKELNETQYALMSNPPTEINYLLQLHRESLKRENELLAVRVYHDHLISSARASFESEVKSIEEEFANAKAQAKDKLLESLEERRKKLKEEKELVDFNEEAVGHPHRAHATRGLRNRASNRSVFSRASPAPSNALGTNETPALSMIINHAPSPIDTDRISSTAASAIASHFLTADDPLSMAALNVNPHLRQSPIFQQLLHLGHHQSKRGGGRRAPTGLPGPIAHTAITPGVWNNFHKSQLGISSAKADEADADMEEIRKSMGLAFKKRKGPTAQTSSTRKKTKQN
ncbi:hypothetical protein DFH28DRAFT_978024 [Melampsora americana]|nr:hypothetical protein DFH28DRAFT_978024 [Melampsora americana]